MHVRRGDTVVVIAGKEKGKRGKVLRVLSKKERVVIERVAMVKRHTKPTQQNTKGGIVEKEGSVAISSVQIWCGKCESGVRVRNSEGEGQKKQRVCVKCSAQVEAA